MSRVRSLSLLVVFVISVCLSTVVVSSAAAVTDPSIDAAAPSDAWWVHQPTTQRVRGDEHMAEEHRGVHWSLLRTHPEYVRLPLERKNFPMRPAVQEGWNGNEAEAGVLMYPKPHRPSHGPARTAQQLQRAKESRFHEMGTSAAGGAPMTGCARLGETGNNI